MFIVKRVYGKSHDYLAGWDSKFGTVCRGLKAFALTFNTEEEANDAAARANTECKGYRGVAKPEGMVFSAVRKT